MGFERGIAIIGRLLMAPSSRGIARCPAVPESTRAGIAPRWIIGAFDLRAISRFIGLCLVAASFFTLDVNAEPRTSLNQYGHVGVLQTPTARDLGEGWFGGGVSVFSPYRTIFFHAQPLQWLSGNFRFAEVTNRDFSFVDAFPLEEQQRQVSRRFTDKGVDIHLRVFDESDWMPAVALGFIDLAGTGLFASEYLVASKRIFNFDFHLGLGWGRLGSASDFDNPLGRISEDFRTRPRAGSGFGGQFELDTYFKGDTALFGAVQWTPFSGPLTLFAELEGNDYQSEPLQNPQEQRSRVNVGANLALGEHVDLAVGWLRGETLTGRLSVMGGLGMTSGPDKVRRPLARPIPAFRNLDLWAESQSLDAPTVERLRRDMKRQGIRLHAISDTPGSALVTVWYSHTMGNDEALAAGRVARSLLRKTGRAYEQYELIEVVAGVESVRMRFRRDTFHQAVTGDLPLREFAESVQVMPTAVGMQQRAQYRDLLEYPAFSTALNPQLRSNIGGPDAFFVGQLLARLSGTVQLQANWSASAAIGINMLDNISDARLRQRFPSRLPRVRSNVGDYLREGRDAYLAQLDTNYIFGIAPDLYGRVSAGIFEEMFGGIASELLYRPSLGSWAVGLELARLRQREFEQLLGFQAYETTTVLVSYYQELPWKGMRLKLTGGRFLAGDRGVRVELSREFQNGLRFGVFATPTDASTEDFGEGSFDKGFYLNIPIELFSTGSGRGSADFVFRPLSRDGGQSAATGRSLYRALESASPQDLRRPPFNGWRQ